MTNENKKDENITTLPHFINVKALRFRWTLGRIMFINSLHLFYRFNKLLDELQLEIRQKFIEDSSFSSEWDKALNNIREHFNEMILEILPENEGRVMSMKVAEQYLEEFKKELMGLEPLEIIDNEGDSVISIESLMNELKDEIKKGNRVSFKLMQELQNMVENLTSYSGKVDKDALEQAMRGLESKVESLVNLSIKAIDSMDLIKQSAEKMNILDWSEQIEMVINDFLSMLESRGIEEIKVHGEFFDGGSMVSIGTVPPDFAPELKKYQVYAVHERGFRYKDDSKIIREAKVITIY